MTDIKITMRKNSTFMGAYHPNKPDEIWLNISEIWNWASSNSPIRATQDDIEEWFTKKLNGIFLQELTCIFKGKDKLRIKGGACNPYCHHEKIVDFMINPDDEDWQNIREFHRRKKIRYLEGVD